MSDSFSETTSVGWLSRIGSSIKGVAIGGLLVLVAVIVLFWNEGRSVNRAKALAEGRGAVVDANVDRVEPTNEGKLVHLSGNAQAAGTLRDAAFGIEAPHALRLARTVEMFQWDEDRKTEKKKKLGGGEERVTTYSYKTTWSESLIDSSDFKQPGHDNPGKKPFPSELWNAGDATLGQFQVNNVILEQLEPRTKLVPTSAVLAATKPANPATTGPATSPATLPSSAAASGPQVADGMLYLGSPNSPKVGDVRVSFASVPPGPISIIARQVGSTFEPYRAHTGELLLVEPGTVSADGMFKHAEDANRMLTWILRAVGFVVLAIGFNMILAPLAVVADVVPFIGSLVGAGTFVAALLLAVPVWCVTVALAWLFYRPLIGIGLLLVAAAVPILILRMRKPKVVPVKPAVA